MSSPFCLTASRARHREASLESQRGEASDSSDTSSCSSDELGAGVFSPAAVLAAAVGSMSAGKTCSAPAVSSAAGESNALSPAGARPRNAQASAAISPALCGGDLSAANGGAPANALGRLGSRGYTRGSSAGFVFDDSVGPPLTCRKLTQQFLDNDQQASREVRNLSLCYQLIAAVLVIGLFIVDSTTEPTVTTPFYWYTELVLTVVWFVEYVLRLWSSVERLAPDAHFRVRCATRWRFAFSMAMMLDFFSLVSLVIDLSIESNSYRGIAALRMLRLMTLFRIERDFKIFSPVLIVLRDKRAQLLATLGIAVLVLSVASVIMFYVEAPTNPEFRSVLLSMWWCTTALTTVGYGDIVPKSGAGRLVACVVAFIGTGMFGLFAGILADGFREAIRRDRRFRKQQSKIMDNNFSAISGAGNNGNSLGLGGLAYQQHLVSQPHLLAGAGSAGDLGAALAGPILALIDERLRSHEERVSRQVATLQQSVDQLRSELHQASATGGNGPMASRQLVVGAAGRVGIATSPPAVIPQIARARIAAAAAMAHSSGGALSSGIAGGGAHGGGVTDSKACSLAAL